MFKCLVAEGLSYAGHADGEHSKGVLIYDGVKDFSMIGTLLVHNCLRNPRIGDGRAVVTNSVMYNWAPGWDHTDPVPNPGEINPDFYDYVVSIHTTDLSFVGNVGIQGPESRGDIFVSAHKDWRGGRVYIDDNIIIDPAGNNLKMLDGILTQLYEPPLWPAGHTTIPAHESLYNVLRTAGPRPGDRDANCARLVKDVAEGTGEIIDSQNEVGGYPNYAETRRSIDVPSGEAAQLEWLDALEDEIAVDRDINLSRLYSLVGSEASDLFAP